MSSEAFRGVVLVRGSAVVAGGGVSVALPTIPSLLTPEHALDGVEVHSATLCVCMMKDPDWCVDNPDVVDLSDGDEDVGMLEDRELWLLREDAMMPVGFVQLEARSYRECFDSDFAIHDGNEGGHQEDSSDSESEEYMPLKRGKLKLLQAGNVRERGWAVEALMVGDGSEGEGRSNKILVKGELYGSAKMTGGRENFHLLDPLPIRLNLVGEVGFRFPTRPIDRKQKHYPRICHISSKKLDHNVEEEWHKNLVAEIIKWCDANPGIAVLMGGQGARPGNVQLKNGMWSMIAS